MLGLVRTRPHSLSYVFVSILTNYSEGDRGDLQCSCAPVDCSGDKCNSIIMLKGESGCNDKCEGCNPAVPSPDPVPTPTPSEVPVSSPAPEPTATPTAEWTCEDAWLAVAVECQRNECPADTQSRLENQCSCTKTTDGCTEDSDDTNCFRTLEKNQDGCDADCNGCNP
jgi:hypothetical protein